MFGEQDFQLAVVALQMQSNYIANRGRGAPSAESFIGDAWSLLRSARAYHVSKVNEHSMRHPPPSLEPDASSGHPNP